MAVLLCLGGCADKFLEVQVQEDLAEVYGKTIKIKAVISAENTGSYVGQESGENNSWSDLYRLYNIDVEPMKKEDMSLENLPDIIPATQEEFETLVNAGLLADIGDLIEKYASEELIEYLYGDGKDNFKGVTYDGKIYGLPMKGTTCDKPYALFIRKDWLDNLGLKVPENMEDLADIAYQFTYNDPDGNGKNDTYGISISNKYPFGNSVSLSPIFQAFGAIPAYNDSEYTFIEKDGQIIWGGLETEKMKDAIGWLKDLYNKGCIKNFYLSISQKSAMEDIFHGKVGIFWETEEINRTKLVYYTYKQNSDVELVVLPNLDGTGEGKNINYVPNTVTQYYGVNKQCEHPEVLIYFMNLAVEKILNPKSAKEHEMYIGDSKNYTGVSCCVTPIEFTEVYYNTYKIIKEVFETGDKSILKEDFIVQSQKEELYELFKKFKRGDIDKTDEKYPTLCIFNTFLGPENSYYLALEDIIENKEFTYDAYQGYYTSEMKNKMESLHELFINAVVEIIRGDKDLDYYDEFVEEWKVQGGQEVLEEVNRLKDK